MAKSKPLYKVTIAPMCKEEEERFQDLVADEVARFVADLLPKDIMVKLGEEIGQRLDGKREKSI